MWAQQGTFARRFSLLLSCWWKPFETVNVTGFITQTWCRSLEANICHKSSLYLMLNHINTRDIQYMLCSCITCELHKKPSLLVSMQCLSTWIISAMCGISERVVSLCSNALRWMESALGCYMDCHVLYLSYWQNSVTWMMSSVFNCLAGSWDWV